MGQDIRKLIIVVLLCTTMFLSGYILGVDNQIGRAIKEIYKPINFEMRDTYWCSNNATLGKAIGMSMFPYSNTGINYYMDLVSFKDIKIGDVITYKINNNTIRHAVINKYDNRLYTAGFNNRARDINPVYADQIVGRDCIFKKP